MKRYEVTGTATITVVINAQDEADAVRQMQERMERLTERADAIRVTIEHDRDLDVEEIKARRR